jgi:hypothetical protein
MQPTAQDETLHQSDWPLFLKNSVTCDALPKLLKFATFISELIQCTAPYYWLPQNAILHN